MLHSFLNWHISNRTLFTYNGSFCVCCKCSCGRHEAPARRVPKRRRRPQLSLSDLPADGDPGPGRSGGQEPLVRACLRRHGLVLAQQNVPTHGKTARHYKGLRPHHLFQESQPKKNCLILKCHFYIRRYDEL